MRYATLFFTLVAVLEMSAGRVLLPQMYSLHVESDIRYRYAHTLVSSSFANPANSSQEASFTVVLPDTAFVTKLLIEDDNSVYEAYVKDKDSAKKEYSEAVKRGKTAAHVAMTARDSNLFTVSVNVASRRKVTFNLTYEELLIRKLGTYRHVLNLDPGQVVLDMSVRITILESSRISYLQVPSFRTTNEVVDETISGDDPLARILRTNPYSAVVLWEPTPEQQQELAAQGLRGQLVVKYDVDREQHPQQILVNNGYFVHFFAPPDLPPLAKHVTFVLDNSGSMLGRKLYQLRGAMYKILNDLRPTDYFSLVKFSSRAKVWDSVSSFSKLSKNNPEFNPVVEASKKNIERAKMVIDGLEANGATNIYKALKVAVQINRLGKKQWKAEYSNAGSRQEHRHPEPMIIFLTDGEPTEGKTDTSRIIIAATNKNKKIKASIFCLALGDNADFNFLKKLSLRNSGFARKIYEASDTALQLTDFYREVASPLLANVTFKYLSQQVESVSLTQKHFYFFYSGSELVVSGHLQPTTPGELLHYEVKGRSPDGLVRFDTTGLPVVLQYEPLQENQFPGLMERLWAYLSIRQMLDRADKKKGRKSALMKQAAQLALKYSFVTPVTSLVVVKPDGTTNQAETVKNSDNLGVHPQRAESHSPTGVLDGYDKALIGRDARGSGRYMFIVEDEDADLGELEEDTQSSLVDFEDIDWMGAFTIETKILLPFGVNNTVEVLGPRITATHKMQMGGECITPEGEAGFCKHLRVCPLSTYRENFTVFLEYFCTLHDNMFAGSCCPYRLIPQTT